MDKTLLILYLVALGGSALYLGYAAFIQRKALRRQGDNHLGRRYGISSDVALAIGLFSLLLSAPFFYIERDKIPSVFFKNPPTLLFLLFSFIGLGFILYAVFKFLKGRSVSKKLLISEIDLSPRGVLSGVVRFKGKEIKREGLKVRLILQRAYVASKRELRIGEVPLWSQEIESVPYFMGNALEVPFKFELGESFPSYEDWEEGYELLLLLEGKEFGVEVFPIKSKGAPTEDISLEEVFREPVIPRSKTAGEVLAERRYSNPWYGLITSSFLVVFPPFMWFLVREKEAFEIEAIKRFLLSGLVGVIVFYLPIYLSVKKLREGKVEEKKMMVKRIRNTALVLLMGSFIGWGYVLFRFLRGDSVPVERLMEFLEIYFIDGLLGMFFLLGIYALFVSLRDLLTRESTLP
ncbi:hypothetical protein BCF55_1570 [Hydrogenivirga caldilitoris]|uniref:Uncharacterized protein n=1 Tax=Hydrogenivirga caldilitoris TaxID=246264 RepID=A0A497XSN5_9AQUI|nr:hypothetical protein [Hydrogenivirga caldilitoris]RLJ71271.1 hypothetical protein BCF55_1570 [Hydrogenivirga caldilitoris]